MSSPAARHRAAALQNAEFIVRYARDIREKDPDKIISRFQEHVREGGDAGNVRICAEDDRPIAESSAARREREADRDFAADLAKLVTSAGARAEDADEFVEMIRQELGDEPDPLDAIRAEGSGTAVSDGWRSFQSAMAKWAARAGVDADGAAEAAGRAAERYARRHARPRRNARPKRNARPRRRPR